MGIKNLVDKIFNKKIVQSITSGGDIIPAYIAGREYYPDANYSDLLKKNISWVYACASKNASVCAGVPLRLYAVNKKFTGRQITPSEQKRFKQTAHLIKYINRSDGVAVEIIEHPFLDVIKSVNAYMNQFDLTESLVQCLDIVGNAYWYIVKDNLGIIQEIWPLMPHKVSIIPSSENFIRGYKYSISPGNEKIFQPDEIVHFKNTNIKDYFYGMGCLEACIMAADLNENIQLFENRLMANKAVPDVALILPKDSGLPSEEEQRRTKKEWKRRYGGINNAGGLAIFAGGADIKQLQLSPREINYLSGRKVAKEEIAAIFGVPLSKLTVEDVNRANAEAGDYAYYKDTISPKLKKIEQKINEKILPIYSDDLFVAFDNCVPEDKEYLLKEREVNLRMGVITINEERGRLGLPPVSWGDAPMNMFSLTNTMDAGNDESLNVENEKSIKDLPSAGFIPRIIKRMTRSVKSLLNQIENRIVNEIKGGGNLHPDDVVSGALNGQLLAKQIGNDLTPYWRIVIEYAGQRAIADINRRISGGKKTINKKPRSFVFDIENANIPLVINKHRQGMVSGFIRRTADMIRELIVNAINDNMSAAEIAGVIKSKFDDIEDYAAERIARTEMIWAYNQGTIEGWKQTDGVVIGKKWLLTDDDRLCEYCESMADQITELNENFLNKGDILRGKEGGELNIDYEDIEHPPLHPNCRCSMVSILSDEYE